MARKWTTSWEAISYLNQDDAIVWPISKRRSKLTREKSNPNHLDLNPIGSKKNRSS